MLTSQEIAEFCGEVVIEPKLSVGDIVERIAPSKRYSRLFTVGAVYRVTHVSGSGYYVRVADLNTGEEYLAWTACQCYKLKQIQTP